MDAKELLNGWPGFAKANAARILSSPALRIETRYDGNPAVLTRIDESSRPVAGISLSVAFDGEDRIVTFSPTPLFPDLWELRDRLADIPGEVVLALVEKECGSLFQFFEDSSRQTFSVKGLSETAATGCVFKLEVEGGEVIYCVEPTPAMEQAFGQLSNLDVTHESIRSLTREVRASYAALEASEEDASLELGDCLVIPDDAGGAWGFEVPVDGLIRVVAPESRTVTFAELADDAVGPVPPGDAVEVYRNGRKIASGVFSKLGSATVVKITGD